MPTPILLRPPDPFDIDGIPLPWSRTSTFISSASRAMRPVAEDGSDLNTFWQLFRLHTHLLDHIFLFRGPCARHVSVLHEQFLLGIHLFSRMELFNVGLMPREI